MYRTAFVTLFAAGVVFAAASTKASAQSIGVTAGTPGIGLEAGMDINDMLGLRLTSGYFRLSHDVESDDVDYNGKLKLFSLGLLGDVYLFDSGFRLTGGAFYNDNHVRLTATPTGNVDIGGTTYTPTQIGRLDGNVDFNEFAPYAGLGYTSNRGGQGFSFVADAGVMFQGAPEVTLASSGPATALPGFAADLERERQSIADDIDGFRYYPVVRVGVAYRF